MERCMKVKICQEKIQTLFSCLVRVEVDLTLCHLSRKRTQRKTQNLKNRLRSIPAILSLFKKRRFVKKTKINQRRRGRKPLIREKNHSQKGVVMMPYLSTQPRDKMSSVRDHHQRANLTKQTSYLHHSGQEV